MAEVLTGRCACGAVHFTVDPPTDFSAHCHCASCRAASGAAFMTWTSAPRERVHIEGDEALRWYRSSPPIRWGFCGQCGSTLFYSADAAGHPESPRTTALYIAASAIASMDRAPSMHVSVEEAVVELADHLPQHAGKCVSQRVHAGARFVLYVADQGRSRDFYRAALQREPLLDVPGMTEFPLAGSAVLGLMPETGIRALLPGLDTGTSRPSRAELYLRMSDALAAHRRAVDAGAVELAPMELRSWGDVAGYLRDPDGHVVSFATAEPAPEPPAPG